MNKIKWEKHGRILKPNKKLEWLSTWAGASCAIPIKKDTFRVYVTGKDSENRSRIGTFVFNLQSLSLSELSANPIIELGERGTFDENGTSYPYVMKRDNIFYLYYLGWIRGVHVPWYNGLGLATSEDGINFSKFSKAPIFERDKKDYLGIGSMYILEEENVMKMWYSRFSSWGKSDIDHKHYYNIKYAESTDGKMWNRFDDICVDFKDESEYAIAKPSVIKIGDKYFMWYSYRGKAYRIGFAISDNGKVWRRYDELVGLEPGRTGWDSQMICYAYVFLSGKQLWMLYNGNGYGSTGLGLASIPLEDFLYMTRDL
jgi:predicted GH43/DUF377 family glycosyl hydrolase